MGVGTIRRYYRLRAEALRQQAAEAVAAVYEAKAEAQPGTQFPDNFPLRDRLIAAGYSVVEELRGATADELVAKGFTRRQAERILEALAGLGG